MANSYLLDLPSWPLALPLPANALLLLYDFGTDEEYSIVPGQVGSGGSGGGGGGGTVIGLRAQCFTAQGLRTCGPFLFDAVPGPFALKRIDNIASMSGQVNYRDPTRADIWIAGLIRYSASATPIALADLLNQLSDDIADIPPAALVLGGELLLRVTPIDTSLSASFLFDGAAAGLVSGRSMTYRVNYTGPPVGNLMPNSQFVDSTIFGVTGAGGGVDIVVGGGQAATVNSNTGNAVLYVTLTLAAGTYRLTVGVLSLDLGTINVDIQSPIGTTPQGGFITSDGEATFDFTVPSGQCLFQFVGMREAVLNHVYLVKL